MEERKLDKKLLGRQYDIKELLLSLHEGDSFFWG